MTDSCVRPNKRRSEELNRFSRLTHMCSAFACRLKNFVDQIFLPFYDYFLILTLCPLSDNLEYFDFCDFSQKKLGVPWGRKRGGGGLLTKNSFWQIFSPFHAIWNIFDLICFPQKNLRSLKGVAEKKIRNSFSFLKKSGFGGPTFWS